jgi:hypothetical protein
VAGEYGENREKSVEEEIGVRERKGEFTEGGRR